MLALLLATAATVVIHGRQPMVARAGAGVVPPGDGSKAHLLDPALLSKVLAATFGLVVVGFGVGIWAYGPLAMRDVAGTLISAVILVYLVHLWILPQDGQGTNPE